MTGREETRQEVLAQLTAEGQAIDSYLTEVDSVSMEEKLVALSEESEVENKLTPWDIDGIVLEALGKIGDAVELDHSDLVYDVIYEAILEAIHRRD